MLCWYKLYCFRVITNQIIRRTNHIGYTYLHCPIRFSPSNVSINPTVEVDGWWPRGFDYSQKIKNDEQSSCRSALRTTERDKVLATKNRGLGTIVFLLFCPISCCWWPEQQTRGWELSPHQFSNELLRKLVPSREPSGLESSPLSSV